MPDQMLQKLLGENFVFLAGGSIAIVAIIASCIKAIVTSNSRERSRREIAAYIAEKAMTPEEGERLMAAGTRKNC